MILDSISNCERYYALNPRLNRHSTISDKPTCRL